MSKEIDDIDEFQSIFANESNVEAPPPLIKKDNDKKVEEEQDLSNKEEKEENLEEIDLSEESNEDQEESQSDEITLPQYKEITKKYPDFFKDFPNLRHAFFRERE